jgi:hypothetical protein
VRLGAEVADVRRHRVRVLAPAVVEGVAVGDRVLGAFLVVDDDADDDAGAARPLDPRRGAAVADEVALGAAEAAPSGLAVFFRTPAQASVVLPRYTSLFGPT